MNLQVAILSQSLSINQGLATQSLPELQPHPIIYEIHGVQPSSLNNNNSFEWKALMTNINESSHYAKVLPGWFRQHIWHLYTSRLLWCFTQGLCSSSASQDSHCCRLCCSTCCFQIPSCTCTYTNNSTSGTHVCTTSILTVAQYYGSFCSRVEVRCTCLLY